MADKTEFDSRLRLTQISKDVQVSENSMPLSPQWLHPKSGESKSGISGGNHFGPRLGHANRPGVMKSPGVGEDFCDNNKKKDVFRPSVLDMESDRRDRWRDEERDTSSAIRRDRWRAGEKEQADNRKIDRWGDSSGRNYGEVRHSTIERRTELGNREINHDQRRESRWSTRWGPDDKETDSSREKWAESGKDADLLVDKESSHVAYHGKDDKEGDHYRPWKMNSQSRGRGNLSHHQAITPNKQDPLSSHGQGCGDNTNLTFSAGRGRVSSMSMTSALSQSIASMSEKTDGGPAVSLPFRYSRTKLLDVYRTTDTIAFDKFRSGVDVPSLTQEEPLEPLAFCTPTVEEMVILKGIDKGDILSSGAPQITKEGSIGRNSTDLHPSRLTTLGSREDLNTDFKDESMENIKIGSPHLSDGSSQEKQIYPHGLSTKFDPIMDYQKTTDYKFIAEASREQYTSRKSADVPVSREIGINGASSALLGSAGRSSSFLERSSLASHDWREIPVDISSRVTYIGWSESPRDASNIFERHSVNKSFLSSDGSNWQVGDDSILKTHLPSVILDKPEETQKVSLPSAEDLILYYKDPQGEIQGPFPGSDIIGWFDAGYFGIDLLVRLAGTPPDSPFRLLGDVMPHLRAKARAPPGFGATMPNEITDPSNKLNFSNFGPVYSGRSDVDLMKNELGYRQTSKKEAENRFLESLMSGSINGNPLDKLASTEGIKGYFGANTGAIPPLGVEGEDNLYLLAKKMTIERQKSLPNPYTPWAGFDVTPSIPKADVIKDLLVPHSRILSSVADSSHLSQPSQNVNLLSVLEGLPERSTTNVNNGVGGWLNFPVQGGFDLRQELDKHHGQNYPSHEAIGMQQCLYSDNSPVTNLSGQVMDNSSSIFHPEKLTSSSLSQDPQVLNHLQQQYLLQQLHSPTPASSQQLSVLDKLLLLRQQQKQEEQQQLLRQQQQLLSQVLSEHNSAERFGDSSYGELCPVGLSAGSAPMDNPRFQPSHEHFPNGSQMQVTTLQDELMSRFDLPPTVAHDATQNVPSDALSSITLSHEIFPKAVDRGFWDHNLSGQIESDDQKSSVVTRSMVDSLLHLEMTSNYQSEHPLPGNELISAVTSESIPSSQHNDNIERTSLPVVASVGIGEGELSIQEKVQKIEVPPACGFEERQGEREQRADKISGVKDAKNIEPRDVKKSSYKKSKKQKPKPQSSDLTKAASKIQGSMSSEADGATIAARKSEIHSVHEVLGVSAPGGGENKSQKVRAEHSNIQNDSQVSDGQRAWKPASGLKPKSLLEIQQEQRRALAETADPEIADLKSLSFSSPWAGGVAYLDFGSLREVRQVGSNGYSTAGKMDSASIQKSGQVHDLLEQNGMPKSSERETQNLSGSTNITHMDSEIEAADENNFIEAKDSKKSRKKSGKSKGSGTKVSAPLPTSDASVGSSPIDNNKKMQQAREVLPPVPSGPSLGDFVPWKGDLRISSPAPAWSTESDKVPKPTSLRDILKEKERRGFSTPVSTPQKAIQNQPIRGGAPSWSVSGSSPAKATSPIRSDFQASLSKHEVEEDLFWGLLDQPKQETKLSDFPQLGNQNSWGNKNTPLKASSSAQTSTPSDHTPASSIASSQQQQKGKKKASTTYSDAMAFQEWCENECMRLVGIKDTSFLEYCMKQPRSEAEILLIQNLGSYDPGHEFIDKFLSFKDFLSAEVLDGVFQSRNERKLINSGPGDVTSEDVGLGSSNPSTATGQDGTAKGGKKKAKKGKKISASVLGFNVVSNRIMMGEIETVED